MQKQNQRAKCTGVKFLVCMYELGNKADSDSVASPHSNQPFLHTSPASLAWEVSYQECSPPERGRVRRTLDMKSLPVGSLNIVVSRHREDVYIMCRCSDTIGTAQGMFVKWLQALY
ncbi:hypothetical protein ILYODFUR_012140 [Ilyodon furcidens]|uniref:Uncharacterized protein n=1 Tax=Ilyodon furcidens TaxID=33524 RepID=A0ABV0SKM8_9TELE